MRLAGSTSVLLVALVLGCQATRPYKSEQPANLTFSAQLRPAFLSRTKVSLDIFFGDECERTYQGSVALRPGDPPVRIGLPTDQEIYARLFLVSGNKTRSDEFRFRPLRGSEYALEYVHEKKAYGKRLMARDGRTGKASELETSDWNACTSHAKANR